jgi:D-alanyl-D-alanine carboxypeptidase
MMQFARMSLVLGFASLFLIGNANPSPLRPATAEAIASQTTGAIETAVTMAGPGVAVLIAQGDRVIYRGARGTADLQLDVPLTDQHVFHIASVTKMFTAAMVLKLAQDGRLSLDDPLARYMPDFPNAAGISIRQLLGHTAGISDRTSPADVQPGFSRRDVDMATLVTEIAKRPPSFAPGTSQAYSNSGYILLGTVIEAVTGKPWHLAMQEELFSPLGINATTYGIASSVIPRRVTGYTRDNPNSAYRNAPYISMTIPASAGALVSTVGDLHRWMRALTAGRVINSASYQQMITPAAPASITTADRYGFGMNNWRVRGEQMIGHSGQINGFTSILAYLPAQDITIIALANDDSFDALTFGHRLAGIAIGRPYPLVENVPIPATEMETLAGSYQLGQVVRTISVNDGRLFMRRGSGNQIPLQMTADGHLHFLPDELSYFTPIRSSTGNIVRLDYYARGDGPPQAFLRVENQVN